MFDAAFWVAISFVTFCLILIYKKIPQLINKLLEDKINEIKSEIENAKNLKIESEKLLKKYKDKIQDAYIESKDILDTEKRDAKTFIKELENKFEQLMINKKKSLEQKLEQMKIKAIKDIQYISNEISLKAVRKIILEPGNIDKIKIINQKNLEKTFIQLKQTKIS